MSPHSIFSWGPGWNEVKIVRSAGAPSVVPIESLVSDPSTKSPNNSDAWRARTTEPGATPASLLGEGTSECETPEDSFQQHGKYFFKDGNVTFLVRRVVGR